MPVSRDRDDALEDLRDELRREAEARLVEQAAASARPSARARWRASAARRRRACRPPARGARRGAERARPRARAARRAPSRRASGTRRARGSRARSGRRRWRAPRARASTPSATMRCVGMPRERRGRTARTRAARERHEPDDGLQRAGLAGAVRADRASRSRPRSTASEMPFTAAMPPYDTAQLRELERPAASLMRRLRWRSARFGSSYFLPEVRGEHLRVRLDLGGRALGDRLAVIDDVDALAHAHHDRTCCARPARP